MIVSFLVAVLGSRALDPTLLVLNKGDNTVSLIQMSSGKAVAVLPTGPNPNEVAVSPDGKTAAISNMGDGRTIIGDTITLVNVTDRKVSGTLKIGKNHTPHGIVWLDNQRIVFTSHATDTLNTMQVSGEGKLLNSLPTAQKGTHLVVFGPGFGLAYAVNAFSGSVTAVDFAKQKVLKQIPTGNRAEGISISSDGKWVACGNVGADNISIIDTENLEISHTLAGVGGPIRTAFLNGGKNLAVSSIGSKAVEIFSTRDWKKVATVDLKQKPIADSQYADQWPIPMNFAVRKNGNLLVVLVTSHAVAEIDCKTWKVVKTYDTGPLPDGMAVSE